MVPHVPKGFDACRDPIVVQDVPRRVGETLRYWVDLNGLSMGRIDFKIQDQGLFEGTPTTEYRTSFELDALVSSFFAGKGRAASMIPVGSPIPSMAMNDYTLKSNHYAESMTLKEKGQKVGSTRSKNGKERIQSRQLAVPVTDFVSAFYSLRSLQLASKGCFVIYGNQRAYTVWVEDAGIERVKTPVGRKKARRYELHYASERSRHTYRARIWVGIDGAHLPYQAEILGDAKIRARVHSYVPGTK